MIQSRHHPYCMNKQTIQRILCVCFGNTCRSPMMQVLLRKELGENGAGFFIDSAATVKRIPTPVSENAKAAMGEMGLSVEGHLSKNIIEVDLHSFDIIIAAHPKVKEHIVAYSIPKEKIFVLNENGGGIPDPLGTDMENYRACAKDIEKHIKLFARSLNRT